MAGILLFDDATAIGLESDFEIPFFVEFERGEGWFTFLVVNIKLWEGWEILQVEGNCQGLGESI